MSMFSWKVWYLLSVSVLLMGVLLYEIILKKGFNLYRY